MERIGKIVIILLVLVLLVGLFVVMTEDYTTPTYFEVDGMTCVRVRDGVDCNWAEWEGTTNYEQ